MFVFIRNIATKYNVSIDWLCGLSDNMTLDNRITTYKDIFRLFITVLDARYENKETLPIIDTIDTETSALWIKKQLDWYDKPVNECPF